MFLLAHCFACIHVVTKCIYHNRPKRRGGTGRLLQKAISDINSVSSSSTSLNKKRKKIHVKKNVNSQDEEEQLGQSIQYTIHVYTVYICMYI